VSRETARADTEDRVRAFFQRSVVRPLLAQLTQGVTPTALAWAVSLGVVIGTFPVLGTTTIICALVGASLRLNQPAIQVGNAVSLPLLLVSYVPFFDLGAAIFGQPPVTFTFAQIEAELKLDWLQTIGRYAAANVRAAVAWALVAPLAVAVLFWSLRPIFKRIPLPAAR
jgi:uncharacterized protein (DUF2062 family)